MSNKPTKVLEQEHHFIQKVVAAVAVLVETLEAGKEVEKKTLQDIVEFMRTFADKCHHGKEEYLAFPMVDKILSAEEQLDLREKFEMVEKEIGLDVHQRFEQFAKKLEEKTSGS